MSGFLQSEGFQEVLVRCGLSLAAKIPLCINAVKTSSVASASSEFEAKFSKHLERKTLEQTLYNQVSASP